jgi:hypothetical protein
VSNVEEIRIEPLDSGFIVSVIRDEGDFSMAHRTAEATLTGALGIAARALGYHGTIEFGTRTVEVPVVGMVPPNVGIPFDDEEPPLRAGTARPDDLL